MRIGNLSVEELAKLLELSLDAALSLQYVQNRLDEGHSRFSTDFMKIDFENRLSGISDEEVTGLMNLTVEEATELYASGELQQRYPFLGKSVPETDSERLKVLRELLKGESEFRNRCLS